MYSEVELVSELSTIHCFIGMYARVELSPIHPFLISYHHVYSHTGQAPTLSTLYLSTLPTDLLILQISTFAYRLDCHAKNSNLRSAPIGCDCCLQQ